MNPSFALLGYCGLFCVACNHYRSSFLEGKHLLDEGVKQGKDPNDFTCKGCRGALIYLHPGCDVCELKLCAEKKELIHCGLCKNFPCDMIISFQNDGHIHHLDVIENLKELKEKGYEEWLKEQEEKWTCDCGMNFLTPRLTAHNSGYTLRSLRSLGLRHIGWLILTGLRFRSSAY